MRNNIVNKGLYCILFLYNILDPWKWRCGSNTSFTIVRGKVYVTQLTFCIYIIYIIIIIIIIIILVEYFHPIQEGIHGFNESLSFMYTQLYNITLNIILSPILIVCMGLKPAVPTV